MHGVRACVFMCLMLFCSFHHDGFVCWTHKLHLQLRFVGYSCTIHMQHYWLQRSQHEQLFQQRLLRWCHFINDPINVWWPLDCMFTRSTYVIVHFQFFNSNLCLHRFSVCAFLFITTDADHYTCFLQLCLVCSTVCLTRVALPR
jgi:hypothetical protein